MRKVFILIYIVFCVSTSFAKPIIVGIYENKPLVYIDDKKNPQGLFIDIIEEVARKEKWNIQFSYHSWNDCLRLLENDSLDILVDIAYSEKRLEKFSFNKENVFVNWGLLYSKFRNMNSLFDLNNKKIIGVKNDIYFDELKVLLDKFEINANFIEVNEYAETFLALQKNIADVAVVNRLFGSVNEKDYNLFKTNIVFRPSELRFASKKNKNELLLNTLDFYLTEMKAIPNSPYYESINRHLSGQEVQKPISLRNIEKYKTAIIVTFAFILLYLVFYIYQKRKLFVLLNKNRKQKLLEILNFFNNAYFEFDENLNIISCSETFQKMVNKNMEHIIGKNVNEFFLSTIDLNEINESQIYKIKLMYDFNEIESRIVYLRSAIDNNIHYGIFVDNIDLKQSLYTIKHNFELQESLFDNNPLPVILSTMDGQVIKYNHALSVLVNLEISTLSQIFDKYVIKEILQHFITYNTTFTCKTQLKHNPDCPIDINVSVNVFNFHNENYFSLCIIKKDEYLDNDEVSIQKSFFNQIYDKSPISVMLVDFNNNIIDVNQEFLKIYKYEKVDLIDTKINKWISFEKNNSNDSLENYFLNDFITIKTKSGNERKVKYFKDSLINDGLPVGDIYYFEDHTEILNQIATLKNNSDFLKSYFVNSPEFLLIINQDAKLKYVSNSFLKLTELTLDEIKDNPSSFLNSIHIDDLPKVKSLLLNDIKLKNRHRVKFRIINTKKETILLEESSFNFNLDNDQYIVFSCHLVDPIIEKSTEMSHKLIYLNNIFNSFADPIVTLNAQGEIQCCNINFLEFTSFNGKDIKGIKIFDLMHIEKNDLLKGDLLDIFKNENELIINDCNIEILNKNTNCNKAYSLFVTKFDYSDGFDNLKSCMDISIDCINSLNLLNNNKKINAETNFLMIFKDLSYYKKIQNEILKQKNLEVLQNSSLHIANDFNNILTAIMGHIALLKMNKNIPEQMLDRIKKAEEASIKAKELTQKIFPLESNKNIEKSFYSIFDLIDNLVESLDYKNCILIDKQNIDYQVYVNKKLTEDAIIKILDNAFESMPNGGKIDINVDKITFDTNNVFFLNKGDYLKISVNDEGNGIDEKNIEKIFEPYFSMKNKEGLGLTQAFHQLIIQHAYININSEIGKGTCVEIYLPLQVFDDENVDKDYQMKKTIKILFMDDEQLVLDIADEYLKKLGFEVVLVKNGNQVMDILKNDQSFDIIILDLVVADGMGAKDTIKHIRNNFKDMVVFLSTGLKTELSLMDYKKFGFDDVIEKPIDFVLLKQKIIKLMA